MKRVTASDARRRWFELLDEVADGEVLVVERRGRRLVMRREDEAPRAASRSVPSYRDVLEAPNLDEADRWGWAWTEPGRPMRLVRRRKR
jgi:antitoxin (DNA-binding transcriptional repressor) of toxin-antitoxin stability system